MFARSSSLSLLSVVGLLLLGPAAAAQPAPYGPPRGHVGISFLIGDPVGEFAENAEAAFGAEFSGRLAMDPLGRVSIRGDLRFMVYGHASRQICIDEVECRVQGQLRTSNNVFFGGIGPELALPTRWARPYVHAFLGFGYFNTTSSLQNHWDRDGIFGTETFGDGTLSWGAGWGLEVNVRRGRAPISLNLGARYHRQGEMEYLAEGDFVVNPDGGNAVFPELREAPWSM